jgi:hypothetical protein
VDNLRRQAKTPRLLEVDGALEGRSVRATKSGPRPPGR